MNEVRTSLSYQRSHNSHSTSRPSRIIVSGTTSSAGSKMGTCTGRSMFPFSQSQKTGYISIYTTSYPYEVTPSTTSPPSRVTTSSPPESRPSPRPHPWSLRLNPSKVRPPGPRRHKQLLHPEPLENSQQHFPSEEAF